MKKLIGLAVVGFATVGAANLLHAQGGDNSGRFSTPAYNGTDFTPNATVYAQAGSGGGGSGGAGSGAAGSGTAAPGQGGLRTATQPGSSSTAIPGQVNPQNNGTAITPGAPAITPGAPAITPGTPAINSAPNTAIMPPTNNAAVGTATNGILPQGIGQQGNTAIGQQGNVGIGQQGNVNPGAQGRPPNAFIVNPDGSVTALGGTAGTALGGTNTGAAAGGVVATNAPPTLGTNAIPRSP